jgi:hypothetical protein
MLGLPDTEDGGDMSSDEPYAVIEYRGQWQARRAPERNARVKDARTAVEEGVRVLEVRESLTGGPHIVLIGRSTPPENVQDILFPPRET